MNAVEAFEIVADRAKADDTLPEIDQLIEHQRFVGTMLKYCLRVMTAENPFQTMAAMHALVHLGILIGKEMSKDAKSN